MGTVEQQTQQAQTFGVTHGGAHPRRAHQLLRGVPAMQMRVVIGSVAGRNVWRGHGGVIVIQSIAKLLNCLIMLVNCTHNRIARRL